MGVVGGSIQEEIEGMVGGDAGPVGLEAVGAAGFGVSMEAAGAGHEVGGSGAIAELDDDNAWFHVSVIG